MNPIDELRAARPAHLGDAPVEEDTRAAELSYAMSGPRQGRRRRAVVRPVWGVSLVGAAAAVTAVAVVMSGNGAPPREAGGGHVAASATAASPKTVTLSARDVLLAAAEKADREPSGSGDWWHTVRVGRTVFIAKEGGYLLLDQQREEGWTPSATGGAQWSRSRSLGARPATEEDRKAWEEAGSPSEVEVVLPESKRGKPGMAALKLPLTPGKTRTSHSPLVDGDKVFWLGRNVTMKDLRGLPDEPGALKKWLLKSYEGHGTESTSTPMSSESWLFQVTVGLITDMPVTPQVRGAAFRMLAALHTVKVTENVTDAEGRQGTAVSIKEDGDEKLGVREMRLILDEATGRALATENVVVEPGGMQTGLEPGTVWNSDVVLESGWTDAGPTR
jgi:hypothetical protein